MTPPYVCRVNEFNSIAYSTTAQNGKESRKQRNATQRRQQQRLCKMAGGRYPTPLRYCTIYAVHLSPEKQPPEKIRGLVFGAALLPKYLEKQNQHIRSEKLYVTHHHHCLMLHVCCPRYLVKQLMTPPIASKYRAFSHSFVKRHPKLSIDTFAPAEGAMKLDTSRRWGTTTFRRDFLATIAAAADEAVLPDVAGVAAGSGASYRFSTIGSIILLRSNE